MDSINLQTTGKEILNEAITECKQLIDNSLKRQQELRQKQTETPYEQQFQYDWLIEAEENQVKLLIKELKNKTFRLNQLKNHGQLAKRGITDEDIQAAKQVPIETFYLGKLRKTGGKLTGLCPFHNEKTSSFFIYTKNNTFHCFGCGSHGDVIDFIIKQRMEDGKYTFERNPSGKDLDPFIIAVKYLTN